jgi:hypothetical protein
MKTLASRAAIFVEALKRCAADGFQQLCDLGPARLVNRFRTTVRLAYRKVSRPQA